MEIILEDISRRFNQEWIFKNISYQFIQGESYAILGPNGSGKSTFLQVLAGSLAPSNGKLIYSDKGKLIDASHIYKHLTLSAPYLELIEEFTLLEIINFHFKFKKMVDGWSPEKLIHLLQLEGSTNKQIRYFSSGMKQRLKLLLAFCSDSPILMLDEPTSNLDAQGVQWYLKMIDMFTADRLLIVCSNQVHEYDFCAHQVNILAYK